MRVLDTPFGRVAGTICHDADFPRYMRQAAELRVEMVRAARGVSFAVGPLGSAIASSNSIAGDGLDMVGLVPVRSLPTVAGTEWGGWITVALATVLAALSALRASMRTQDGDDRPV